uniref:Ketoreductase domain-containing protein n=1 Tax=Aureoumbra lagunensis TaxID=44058 RepID=A0A7S3JYE0_9STRA|mmetsp:Transcript_20216/g.30818  ORF Transcript_20216/g.30818 Transcript_20216/m.30818 type:complete len:422 (-) Transcript_20216:512-1777(-)
MTSVISRILGGDKPIAPGSSPLQREASLGKKYEPVPKRCVVTGGTGFVGQRLVEMLVERGAEKVISLDIVPAPADAWKHPAIEWRVCDVTDSVGVRAALRGNRIDCVWHNAAAVGPFHPKPLYTRVNYQGTLNILAACRDCGVPKLVFSSSPSTRFIGTDVDGLTEDEMPSLPLKKYLQEYAKTKAMAEMAVSQACCDDLLTVSVAPHQVYGPRDNLFLPNLLENAGNGKLRVFGKGLNRICFTHVDNYCHGLIIAERKLFPKSPVLAKFYIVTDGHTHPDGNQYLIFWKELDKAVIGMGFTSLWSKAHLPVWFLMILAYISEFFGFIFRTTFKLNVFNVRVLIMHRWFDIKAAINDLDFQPIIPYEKGWQETIEWFKTNWLPSFVPDPSLFGIAKQSQIKIDIQEASRRQDLQKSKEKPN